MMLLVPRVAESTGASPIRGACLTSELNRGRSHNMGKPPPGRDIENGAVTSLREPKRFGLPLAEVQCAFKDEDASGRWPSARARRLWSRRKPAADVRTHAGIG